MYSIYVYFLVPLMFFNFNVMLKQKLGGATAEIMSDLLAFEADRRAVNISINRLVLRRLFITFLFILVPA